MPLTDDEIRAILEGCDPDVTRHNANAGFNRSPQNIAELCTRLLEAEAEVSELQGALSLWIGSDNTAASAARDDRKILLERVKVLEEAQRNCCLENGECGLAGILDYEDQPALQEQSK
jgi:hypothetical protein